MDNKLNGIKYNIFESSDIEEEFGTECLVVISIQYNDFDIEKEKELMKEVYSLGFLEEMENVYSFKGSKEEIESLLNSNGLIKDEEINLSDYLEF